MSITTELRYVATDALKRTIRSQGRKDVWFAERIGVSKGHFSHVLAGRRPVNQADAELIAAVLGMDFFVLWKVSDGDELAPKGTTERAA